MLSRVVFLAGADEFVRPALGHRQNPELQGLRSWSNAVVRIIQSIVMLKSNAHVHTEAGFAVSQSVPEYAP